MRGKDARFRRIVTQPERLPHIFFVSIRKIGFEELKEVASSAPSGNNSMVFSRTPNSWHGVLNCPEGTMRRLFKVTANAMNFQVLWRKYAEKIRMGSA